MRCKVIADYQVETPNGTVALKPGQMIELDKEEAMPMIQARKVKPVASKEQVFCYWKAGNVPVSECVKPCMTFKEGRTTSQCQYFAGH